MNRSKACMNPGRVILFTMAFVGLYVTIVRFTKGLGAVTALSDQFPWGLWIGFDVLCGVALAAGAFTIAAARHIFHMEKYDVVLRPAILTGFLGYMLVVIGLLFDLGRPYRIWHPLIMWQPHSVMFEVAWCVMLYTTVLALEFSPVVFERLRKERAVRIIRGFTIPLVILGVILSTLHQSSLGSLFLIAPAKLHPLWYTPLLPVLFFISAVGVGPAMVIIESWFSARVFRRSFEKEVMADLARMVPAVLLVYFALKLIDLGGREQFPEVFAGTTESLMFIVELVTGVVAPAVLLSLRRVRETPPALAGAAGLVVIGLIINRLNVSLVGMGAAKGLYFPTWMEISVTAGIVAFGVLTYLLIAYYLPVFPKTERRAGSSQLESAGGD
ncbi:MAG: Ni/Fe-hydrogenase cytochrome b subunit [Firmicutes bacterium]|nr:Ni/Fe-hydrogenase cytochrome b subunit [Bacillota bacterium]